MEKDKIGLSEAISALRSDLEKSMKEGEGHPLRLEVQSLDLELQATVALSGTGNAGIKWWLIDASAEGTVQRENVQTVKISLKPIHTDGPSQNKPVWLTAPNPHE